MDAKTNFLEEWAGGETIRGGPKTGQVEFKTWGPSSSYERKRYLIFFQIEQFFGNEKNSEILWRMLILFSLVSNINFCFLSKNILFRFRNSDFQLPWYKLKVAKVIF
jgi:hypothetical protein